MPDIESQLRDYWSGLVAEHPLPSAAELIDPKPMVDEQSSPDQVVPPFSANGTTPVVEQDEGTLVELDHRRETKENTMSTKQWLLIAAAAAVVILIAGIVVISVQDDDTSDVDTVDTVETPDESTATTVAPTTSTSEAAAAPAPEMIEVPFHVLNSGIPPEHFTCLSMESGFEVEFVDDAGESMVVAAKTEKAFAPSIADPPINTTCTDIAAAADGEPAILFSAVLDVPAAETYESIGIKYTIFDDFETFFEMVTAAEAEAGLYIEFGDDDQTVIGPSEIEALQLAE